MTRENRRHAGRGSGTGASAGATGPPATERPANNQLDQLVLTALGETRHQTLFATELAAVVRPAGCAGDGFEQLLAGLERTARVLVLGRPPPDVHLAGTDLRTVHALDGPSPAAAELARRRGEEHWAEFLRTFLATRRCC